VNTLHRKRLRRIDTDNAGMGHWAGEQPAKEHPVGAKVFRVFRLPVNLPSEIGRNEIIAEQ
jgi:hypothetical protein